MGWMFSAIWSFIQTQLENDLLSLCQQILKLIASCTANFWNEPAINVFLDFSKWANTIVFVVSLIFMLFDMGEEMASGKGIDYGMVFSNSVKAIIFVEFNCTLAEMSMQVADVLTTGLHLQITNDTSIFNNFMPTSGSVLFMILMLLAILIAMIVFFVMSVMRYGGMFVHILSSSLYITDILRGDTTSMGAWIRQMVAIAGTYIIQYYTFYLGMYYLIQKQIIMCAICWTGMFGVSKILQKFGYSTGTRGVFNSLGSLASQGIGLLAKP